MLTFIARRFVYMVVTILFVSVMGFIIINLPPGSYLDYYISQLEAQGTLTSESQIETLKRQYGLDDPPYVQYVKWATGFFRGDFGRSFQYNRDVSELLWGRLGFTMVISVASLALTWLIAIPIGVYSATHQYSLGDSVFTVVGLAGLSIPDFMLALILMVFASQVLKQEVGGLYSQAFLDEPMSWAKFVDLLKHLWIPTLVVATSGTAGLIRIMRGNLLDILNMQYVQAARARGLKERKVIVKHAVRNAVHPLIMLLGMSLPGIISGATVVSIVLSLPTTGPLYFNALQQKDMYLAVTFLMFLSIALVIGNFLA
ncbi:MAG: ABC transporter permease, partial [Anaerolineae bacterium]|nr:ABC transporter permease [Anaerolineae bacterium]